MALALNGDIYTVAAMGGPLHRLTSTGRNSSPQLSPDGRMITYLSSPHRSGYGDGPSFMNNVWIVPVNGRGDRMSARAITALQPAAEHTEITWSPDSQRIAYEEGNAVVVVDVANGMRRVVLRMPPPFAGKLFALPIAWSPDARWIAIALPIFSNPAYSPNALRILSASVMGDSHHEVVVQFPAGSLGHPIPPGSYPDTMVWWTPNGRGFMVETLAKGEGPPSPTGLWQVNQKGGLAHLFVGTLAGVQKETYPPGSPLHADTRALFSPDQLRLVTNPDNRFWIADADGRHGRFINLHIAQTCTLVQFIWLSNSAGLAYIALCISPSSSAKGFPTTIVMHASLFTIGMQRGARSHLLYAHDERNQTALYIAPISQCVLCGF